MKTLARIALVCFLIGLPMLLHGLGNSWEVAIGATLVGFFFLVVAAYSKT